MSKLNVQMTFAVILTLAFIFYPVIGYSQSGGDYFYDSRQRVCTGRHPSSLGPASRNFKVLRYPRIGPASRNSKVLRYKPDALSSFVQNQARDQAINKGTDRLFRNAPGYIQKGMRNIVNPVVSEILFPPKIGEEPLIHPTPPARRGKIDQGWGSSAPSSSKGSRTRSSSSSSDRSGMWDAGSHIRKNRAWREQVHRRDWEETRPGEDKFKRADRLNYGPQTRELLNRAPYTPKDPPNQTRREAVEN